MQFKDFNDKTLYKYIGETILLTPNGVITKEREHSYTGERWKEILVYDFSERTPPIDKMFKEVKK